jgi:hypothetical protein
MFNPERILRLETPACLGHVPDGNCAPLHQRHACQPPGIITCRAQHSRTTSDAMRIVAERDGEQGYGKFFVRELILAHERLFRFGPIRIMPAAALDGQNLKFPRPQPQPPRLPQQRRQMRGGAQFRRQRLGFHRGHRVTHPSAVSSAEPTQTRRFPVRRFPTPEGDHAGDNRNFHLVRAIRGKGAPRVSRACSRLTRRRISDP